MIGGSPAVAAVAVSDEPTLTGSVSLAIFTLVTVAGTGGGGGAVTVAVGSEVPVAGGPGSAGFVASTSTTIVAPSSTAASPYVGPVTPVELQAGLQRCHVKVSVVPDVAGADAVSVWPTTGEPAIVGAPVSGGPENVAARDVPGAARQIAATSERASSAMALPARRPCRPTFPPS